MDAGGRLSRNLQAGKCADYGSWKQGATPPENCPGHSLSKVQLHRGDGGKLGGGGGGGGGGGWGGGGVLKADPAR